MDSDNVRRLISNVSSERENRQIGELSVYINFECNDELKHDIRNMFSDNIKKKLKGKHSSYEDDNRALSLLNNVKQIPEVVDSWFTQEMDLYVELRVKDHDEGEKIAYKIQKMDSGLKDPNISMADFAFPTTFIGRTDHFNIYYNPNLGYDGKKIADDFLKTFEKDYDSITEYFGGITPRKLPFQVIIAGLSPPDYNGTMGAYHYGCEGTELYVDIKKQPRVDINLSRFLAVSQMVEVFSATHSRGWDCAKSNGEALSRVLATELYPNELGVYATAGYWLSSTDRPNFIENNEPIEARTLAYTDNPDHRSLAQIGCSVLFLNFLHYYLKFDWKQIIGAGGNSLGKTYTKLTGDPDGFSKFKNVLEKLCPPVGPYRLDTDNTFSKRFGFISNDEK